MSLEALFVRVSGLFLVVLAGVQVLDVLVLRDPEEVTPAFLVDRLQNPAWQLVIWATLLLGAVHGVLGVRWMLARSAASPGLTATATGLVAGVVAVILAYATWAIFFAVA